MSKPLFSVDLCEARNVPPDSLFLFLLLSLHFSPFSSGLLPIQRQVS